MFDEILLHFSDNAVNYILAGLVLALPTGITLAIFTDNAWWLLLSAASVVIFFAG